MNTSAPLRCYVTPLVDWARDGPASSERIRAVMHPLGELLPWMDKVIAPCYWRSLNQPRGLTMPQFIDECRERVFIWAKANVAPMLLPEFSDENLKAMIGRIACNVSKGTWRKIKRERLEHLDDYLETRQHEPQTGRAELRRTPESLTNPPEEYGLRGYPELEENFDLACWIMPMFNRSLRAMKKMRAVLALLHRLGRREGKLENFPAYWFVWRLLRRKKRTHLPRYIQKYLRACLPQVEYGVINARLRCLRRALASFLLTL